MHILTKIEGQAKNKNRVNIYIDGSYSFACHMEIILKYGLREGMEIDRKELWKLIEEDENQRAFQAGLHYLSYKPRTNYEMRNYLIKKGYKDSTVEGTLEKLLHYKYIDDHQYAKSYIINSMETKKKSSEIIRLDLIKRGIPSEIIHEYISIFTHEKNLEIAREISNEYFYRKSDLPFKQLKNKLTQLLVRRGFSWEIINNCLNFLEEDVNVQLTLKLNENKQKSQVLELAERYFTRYGKNENNDYILTQKVKQALYRRGYDMDMINTVVNDLLSDYNRGG